MGVVISQTILVCVVVDVICHSCLALSFALFVANCLVGLVLCIIVQQWGSFVSFFPPDNSSICVKEQVFFGILSPSDDLTKPLGWVLHAHHACHNMGHCRISSPHESCPFSHLPSTGLETL